MEENKYILAMYDIRGKQEYIYKSAKMKEIVGASFIIRDCFIDYLFPSAEKYAPPGIYSYQVEKKKNGKYGFKKDFDVNDEFSKENFEKHLGEGYIAEVVYEGGGNFFVLFKDWETYCAVNRIFYQKVLSGTYSLRVLTSYINNVNFDDYSKDQKRLYKEHRKRECEECAIHPVNAFPFVQVDYQSSMPLAEKVRIVDKYEKVSYESARKYEKYEEVLNHKGSVERQIEGARLLDKLITGKGEDSHLAVIYIDGNNMGAQMENCINGQDKSYKASVKALRSFSNNIQKHYIEKPIKAIDEFFQNIGNQEEETKQGRELRRFAIYAGDEMTFVCNAKYAYEVVRIYFQSLLKDWKEVFSNPPTSCAGISIFHSHSPFAEAYRIAEECCESGKIMMKEKKILYANMIDFHYCQGAIGTSLEDIRKHEEMTDMSRPWMVNCFTQKEENSLELCDFYSVIVVEKMKKELGKISRSNLKTLMFEAKKGQSGFDRELARILAHCGEEKQKPDFTLGEINLDTEHQRLLIYDMMLVFDFWFRSKLDKKEND